MSNRVASNNLVMSYKPGRQRGQLPIAIDGKPKHGTGLVLLWGCILSTDATNPAVYSIFYKSNIFKTQHCPSTST